MCYNRQTVNTKNVITDVKRNLIVYLEFCITVQFGAPMVSGNYCVTGLLRILHSTVLYLALKKLSFGWKVLRYTVYLPTLYSALR